MIRMEYPKANIEGLTDREKIYALKKQLDTLTNNVQLVLESIDGDIEGINEYIGGASDSMEDSVQPITERVDAVESDIDALEEAMQFEESGYTPNFVQVSGLTIANPIFKYFRVGKMLYILGRFQVTAVNTSVGASVQISLPNGMTAKNMGVGACGQAVDGVGNDDGFSIRCDGGSYFFIQANAGGYSVPKLVANHYYMINALLFLN